MVTTAPRAPVRQATTPLPHALLERSCACGGEGGPSEEGEELRKKLPGGLQRSPSGPAPAGRVPPIVHNVLETSGQPLDASVRALMEPRFGHDFSQVRVHTDRRAARSAGSVAARAYTLGSDIVFAAGQYAPHTPEGRRLLAHELTHVVQQGPAAQGRQPAAIGPANDTFEREAVQIAEHVVTGDQAPVREQAGHRIQRNPGWSSDAIEINLQPVDPLTPGQESYTENGFLSQRMSAKLPVYRGPFCQSVTLPFNCIVEFRTDYINDPRPQPITPLQASVDFEFNVTKAGAKVQKLKKSFSDKAASYTSLNQPLKTNFGTKFNLGLDDNGDFRMVFKLFDPDTGITRLYDDTIQVEANRPCM